MTLDEAIKHAEEVAYQKDLESGFDTDNERYAMTDKEKADCKECAEEHRQLAEWLKDFRRLLEQHPCEDTISRQTLIERINNAEEIFKSDNMESIASDDGDPFVDGVLSGVFSIRQMVIQAPSITPQPKKGRWVDSILNANRSEYFWCWECSECGWEIYNRNAMTNYCPSCGAKMEEVRK